MKLIKKILLIVLFAVILSSTAFADNPNIGQGDVVDIGSGTKENQWRTKWEGVRITVVDRAGNKHGISYDWLRFTPESSVIYFGNVSKLEYSNGKSLSGTTEKYIRIVDKDLPRIIPETNESTLEELREYFTEPYIVEKMLKYTLNANSVDFSTGDYKIIIEPLIQIKYNSVYYIMTATEVALFEERRAEAEEKAQSSFFYAFYSVSHINLPMAIILEESDLGYPVFTTDMTTKASGYRKRFLSNDTILDVGVGIGIIPLEFDITETHNEGGNVTPEGTTSYGYGSDAKYVITPDDECIVRDVIVDGESVGAVSEYEFTDIRKDHTIDVTFAKEENVITIMYKGLPGGSFSTKTRVKAGEDYTANITLNKAGYKIKDVAVDGTSKGVISEYKFKEVYEDHLIVVTCEETGEETFNLKISVNGSGTVNPGAGTHAYEKGKKVTVKITPAEGWELDKITDNGTKVTNTKNYKVTMDKDHDVVVTFKQKAPETHDLNITVNGSGSVTPGAGTYMVEDGATVPIEIAPNSGWEIGSITDNGRSVTPTEEYNVTVNEDHNIVVTFTKEEKQKYTVTIKAQGSGTGTVLVQDVAVASGDTRTIEVSKGSTLHFTTSTAADSYMQSAKVTLNGRTTTVTTEDFTITNLSSNATVVVTFGVDSTPNHQGISSENMGGDGSLKAGYGFYLDQKFTYPTYDHSTWSKTDGAEYKVTVKSVDATYASISFQTASGPVNIPVTLEKGSDGLYHFPKAGVNNLRKLYVPVETLDGTYTLYVTVEATLEVQTWNRQLTANYGLIPQYKDVIDPETGEPVIDEETGEVKQEFSHYKWGWLGTYSWAWETLTSEREYSDTVTYAIVIKGVMYEDDFTGDR